LVEITGFYGPAKDVARFVYKKYRQRRAARPFRGFGDHKCVIILSSLYPRPGDVAFKPTKFISENKAEGYHVSPPAPFTGIRDAFGLGRLTAQLVKMGVDFELRVDPVGDEEKLNDLILFGSPSSNLLAKEYYEEHLPSECEFAYDANYSVITFQGVKYEGGQIGHVLKHRNPWNPDRKLLWLAGLGPLGTEAAALFCIENFDSRKISLEVVNSKQWIALISARLVGHYVRQAVYAAGKPLH